MIHYLVKKVIKIDSRNLVLTKIILTVSIDLFKIRIVTKYFSSVLNNSAATMQMVSTNDDTYIRGNLINLIILIIIITDGFKFEN